MGYFSASSMHDALGALQQDSVSIIAGGTDWFPAVGDGPTPKNILDITRVAEFQGISRQQDGWRLGAATTWSDVIAADLPPRFDALKAAAQQVGSVQIQNVGTLAGNICNASPAADGVPPLLCLDAMVEIVSKTGARTVGLADFITGVRKTALGAGELVSALTIAERPGPARSRFIKLGSRKYLVISIAMVAVELELGVSGRIGRSAVAVGACSPVARRLASLEAAIIGMNAAQLATPGLVTPDHLAPLSPISDVRGSAAFRADVVAELCQRAIVDAASGRADGQAV